MAKFAFFTIKTFNTLHFKSIISPLAVIAEHPGKAAGITLLVKRDDLLHPDIHGNKWRKLAPVLPLVLAAYPQGILTFGGPFSNHLHAVAAAGRLFNIPTVGIVRGAHADLNNPTLQSARQNGMRLFPVSRQEYDAGKDRVAVWAGQDFSACYLLPEGGATAAAVESCAVITREIEAQLPQLPTTQPDKPLYLCVPAGTGCTAAGVLSGFTHENGRIMVFPVVNKGFDWSIIAAFLSATGQYTPAQMADAANKCQLIYAYEFGGFAKFNPQLMAFVDTFRQHSGILLDPIYTAKMMVGIYDMLEKGDFLPGSTVVALHTGGLQGWGGVAGKVKKEG